MYGGGALLVREAARRTARLAHDPHARPGLRLDRRRSRDAVAVQSTLPRAPIARLRLHSAVRHRCALDRLCSASARHLEHRRPDRPGGMALFRPAHNALAEKVALPSAFSFTCLASRWSPSAPTRWENKFIASSLNWPSRPRSQSYRSRLHFCCFVLPKRSDRGVHDTSPRPTFLGVFSFFAGSAFQIVTQLGSGYLSPWVGVPILLALPLAGFTAARAAQSCGWPRYDRRLARAWGATGILLAWIFHDRPTARRGHAARSILPFRDHRGDCRLAVHVDGSR